MNKSILVVDDDEVILEFISMELTEDGYYVQTALNAASALIKMGEHIFDLVITDVQMPGDFSGLDFLRIVKCGQNVPVIVMSGMGSIQTAFEAIKEGAEDYLAKPIDLNFLKQRVNRILSSETKDSNVIELDTEWTFAIDRTEKINYAKIIISKVLEIQEYDSKLIVSALRIIEEGVMNGLQHSAKKPLENVLLTIAAKKMGLTIKIADYGNGFDWREQMTSLKPERESARGLFFIKTLSNEMSFNESGNELTVKIFC